MGWLNFVEDFRACFQALRKWDDEDDNGGGDDDDDDGDDGDDDDNDEDEDEDDDDDDDDYDDYDDDDDDADDDDDDDEDDDEDDDDDDEDDDDDDDDGGGGGGDDDDDGDNGDDGDGDDDVMWAVAPDYTKFFLSLGEPATGYLGMIWNCRAVFECEVRMFAFHKALYSMFQVILDLYDAEHFFRTCTQHHMHLICFLLQSCLWWICLLRHVYSAFLHHTLCSLLRFLLGQRGDVDWFAASWLHKRRKSPSEWYVGRGG